MSADPEGIAWFERKQLKTDLYDPEDAKQFYNTALIEVPYNDAPTHLDDGGSRKNLRLEKQFNSWTRWKYLDVMYGWVLQISFSPGHTPFMGAPLFADIYLNRATYHPCMSQTLQDGDHSPLPCRGKRQLVRSEP